MLTNDVVSFEQPGPLIKSFYDFITKHTEIFCCKNEEKKSFYDFITKHTEIFCCKNVEKGYKIASHFVKMWKKDIKLQVIFSNKKYLYILDINI